jgi:CDP-diacylglycerol--serine O-phosphatidyltransferase
MSDEGNPKIYLLPNLMTAGNLFCGFAATLKILEGALVKASAAAAVAAQPMADAATTASILETAATQAADKFHIAIWCILASCLFDALDGRLARLGGNESPFGREFDSLADIVSFGVAPALMVYKIVLHEFPRTGWIIASLYLVCGALRLARFNCLAAANSAAANKEFKGFPIPAAAGVIASVTLCLLWFDQSQREIGNGKWVLPPLMIFLSWMMFSGFKYPSFKAINWRTTRSIPKFIAIIIVIIFTALNFQWMPAVIFIAYLLYGFLRPFLSRKMKQEIEEEVEDEEEPLESP